MVLWHHSYIEIKWSSLYLNYNTKYTALTTLGIMQEAEQIMANVFYSTFLNVFFNFCHVFTFFNVFFLGTFFTSVIDVVFWRYFLSDESALMKLSFQWFSLE